MIANIARPAVVVTNNECALEVTNQFSLYTLALYRKSSFPTIQPTHEPVVLWSFRDTPAPRRIVLPVWFSIQCANWCVRFGVALSISGFRPLVATHNYVVGIKVNTVDWLAFIGNGRYSADCSTWMDTEQSPVTVAKRLQTILYYSDFCGFKVVCILFFNLLFFGAQS